MLKKRSHLDRYVPELYYPVTMKYPYVLYTSFSKEKL